MADVVLGAVTGFLSFQQSKVRSDNGWITMVEAGAKPSVKPPFDQFVGDKAAGRGRAIEPAMGLVAPRANAAVPIAKAHNAFEAVALQVFVSSMLPNDQGGKFSVGSAGRMWKSVLAEKIADQISASGRVRLMPGATFAKAIKSKLGNVAETSPHSSAQTAAATGSWHTTIETPGPSSGAGIPLNGRVSTSNGE